MKILGGSDVVTSPRRTARTAPPTLLQPRASRRRKHAIILTLAGLFAAGAVAATVLAWPEPTSPSTQHIVPILRARTYSQVSDCLLTDSSGVQGTLAAAVWAGMQAASAATHAQVSYLPVQGADTAANAEVYINTLAMRGCSVILAAGAVPAQGAADRAANWPNQRIVTITTSAIATARSSANRFTAIVSGDTKTLTSQIKTLLVTTGPDAQPTA